MSTRIRPASDSTRLRPSIDSETTFIPTDPTLVALAVYNSNGFIVQTSLDTFTGRTLTGSSSVTVTDGNGIAANPSFAINASWAGQSSIVTLGTVTTGTWNATPVAVLYGGTGATTVQGAINAISPLTTKGDLLIHNGTNNVRFPVGANGTSPVADSAEALGIRWEVPSGAVYSSGDKLALEMEMAFKTANLTNYKVLTWTLGQLTAIDIWTNPGMTVKLFNKVLSYTGDQLTSTVLTRITDSATLTKTLAYDIDDNLINITTT